MTMQGEWWYDSRGQTFPSIENKCFLSFYILCFALLRVMNMLKIAETIFPVPISVLISVLISVQTNNYQSWVTHSI